MPNRMKGIILAVMAAVLWGIMGIFVRALGSLGFTSFDITFLRCILAGVGFFLFVLWQNPAALKINGKGLITCLIYGAVSYGLGFMSYNISVQRIPVSVATVLMFMSPIWVMLIGALVFHEKIQKKKMGIIAVCVLGAVMVSDLIGTTGVRLDLIGILAGVFNGFGVALQIMIPRYFQSKYSKDTMLVYGFFGGAILLAFFTNFHSLVSITIQENTGYVLYNMAGIGLLCTLVANVAYVKSSNYVSTNTTSILSALEVVAGSAVGVLMFQETMSVLQIIGAVTIVVASLGSELLGSSEKSQESGIRNHES